MKVSFTHYGGSPMPSSEFQVVSALQRRKRAARTRTVVVAPTIPARTHATSVRLTRDAYDVRNVTHARDRSAVLARIAACDPPEHVAGVTDFDPTALHATPELIRCLSVVPHVPDPTVTESTWDRNFCVQYDAHGVTHARDLGDRFNLRGVASRDYVTTPDARFADAPTVLVHYADGARTLPVSRFDPKESVHLRAIHENARRDNAAREYGTSRELTMRELIRARSLEIVGTNADVD